jgi:dienelactone hydrolase
MTSTTLRHGRHALVFGTPARLRHPRPVDVAAILGGIGLAMLVGLDGSPLWQVVRVGGVVAATALLLAGAARSARWGARLAVAFGVPAIAIGAGFAPHWAKGGPVPVQVAAALVGVSGLALAIGGTVAATEGRRWWPRIGAGLAVTVAVGMAAFVAGPAVAATNVPRPAIGAGPSAVGLRYTDVMLRTSDGVDLAAWYVPSSNGAAVVLLHGAGSTRSNVLEQAGVLAGAGFGVLMVDARGHGESAGRAMDFGWYGDVDVAAATTYLQSRADVDPDRIGAVGLSMGGEEAIGASGTDRLIRAVVAEGASVRNAADDGWLSERYGARGAVQEQIERAQDWVTDRLTRAGVPPSLRSSVASSGDTRYLLITAGDVDVEGHAAAHIAAGAPGRVDIWTVPGAGHTDGLATAPQEWAERVIGFLDATLLAGTGRRS